MIVFKRIAVPAFTFLSKQSVVHNRLQTNAQGLAFLHAQKERLIGNIPSPHLSMAKSITNTNTKTRDTNLINKLKTLGKDLTKQVLENEGDPSIDRCKDLVQAIKDTTPSNISMEVMDETKLGKLVTKSIKSFKRHQRTSKEPNDWQTLIDTCEMLLAGWKRSVQAELDSKKQTDKFGGVDTSGFPKNVAVYKERMVRHHKELYKDPPVLPPHPITIQEKWKDPPKRTKNGDYVFEDFADFTPNRSPEEILRAGSFGGTYFRSIHSAVTGLNHDGIKELMDTVDPQWIEGLNKQTHLISSSYREEVNKYGPVKCGGSLGMWESSGWITYVDPYGWFQWYCRFFRGRRTSDDERQISRWAKSAGFKGRFRSQLCNKILAANTKFDDPKISPVIRQNLLHWGFEVTPEYLEKHSKRK